MKICSNCKSKNNDDSIYCTNCGRKFKKEADLTKIVLLVGVFLVLFSSIFFGILNWENMNNLFRFLFFCFETCLFFIMSLALKKVSNMTSRIFFVIGLVLTPFTLSLVPYYNLVPSILYNEALIYLYLAIIYLLTFVSYILINIKFKGKILNYLSLLSLLTSFIFASLIFNKNTVFIGLLVTLYMLVINILSRFKLFNENKAYYNFSVIVSFLLIPLLVFNFLKQETFEIIINIITLVIFMADTYLKLIFNKKSIMHFFAPFMFQLLSLILFCNIFRESDTLAILSLSIFNIALYFVTLLFKNKMFSITTLVLTHIMLAFLTLLCLILPNNVMLLVVSLLALGYNLSLLIIKKYNFTHIFITLNVLFSIIGLNALLYNFGALIIIAFLLILYLIIYLVLNLINNKYDFIYLIIMLVIGFIGMIIMADDPKFSVIKLIVLLTFVIGYILINILKEHVSIRIIWFVILNLLTIAVFNNMYYSLLAISIFTIVAGIILQKTTKLNFKPYILYAEIVAFIITLFNTMDYSIYSLFINVLAFILGYIGLINFHNKKPWKIAYIMVGLLYITKLLGVIIEPVVIYSLIAIIIDLIIIISMYLLDRFNSKELVIISLVTLIPYFNLVSGLETNLYELYLIPFVVYHIVVLFIIKWKNETNRNVYILIPFFLVALLFIATNSGVVSTIIDAVFAVSYMIIGLVKKYNLLIYFSIGVLVFTILFKIFTVLNSMAAIIALLVVGFILIFVAVFYSTRKKD